MKKKLVEEKSGVLLSLRPGTNPYLSFVGTEPHLGPWVLSLQADRQIRVRDNRLNGWKMA